MGKAKSKKAKKTKTVRFTDGTTSPNNTLVELSDKNSAKVGIDIPSVGFSSTHFLHEDEIPHAFARKEEFDAARLEAESNGEISPRTGNISGIHMHTNIVRQNTKTNAIIAKDVKRAIERAKSSRNSNKKGMGYRKTKNMTKKRRK